MKPVLIKKGNAIRLHYTHAGMFHESMVSSISSSPILYIFPLSSSLQTFEP